MRRGAATASEYRGPRGYHRFHKERCGRSPDGGDQDGTTGQNFPVARGICSKPVASLSVPALDCRLSLRVENVKPGRAHGNAQLIAHLHPHGRLDARHHDALADLHIEQDFRAELLNHLDYSIEARMVEIGGARHCEVLRSHAERDLVADMAA